MDDEKKLRLASALAQVNFSNRDWHLLSDFEKDNYIKDVEEFQRALDLAGYILTFGDPK